MDEDSNVLPSNILSLDRYRSPRFSREEIKTLIKLVEQYKTVILNKSTVAYINHAKEAVWVRIAEIFNSQGFRHTRHPDRLKTKWENLKRNAKKVSINLMDPKYDEYGDLTNPVVALLCEAEMSSNLAEIPPNIKEELNKVMNQQKIDKSQNLSDNYNQQESDHSDNETEVRKMRSLNFSPKESNLLLKCIREEQKFIFSKRYNKNAMQLKRKAWSRITEAFNKRSPQKRSTIALQTKFGNMKRNVKNRLFKNKKHKRLVEEEMKSEPQFDNKMSDVEYEDNIGDDTDDDNDDEFPIKNLTDITPDPIDTAFGSETTDGDNELSFRRNRAINFSPEEVSLLLKCVKEEHKHIFTRDLNTEAVNEKNRAWIRVTDAFNKKTQLKRSTKMLQTKFRNLPKSTKNGRSSVDVLSNCHEPLVEENSKDIKLEPQYGDRSESDDQCEEYSAAHRWAARDPLAAVLSSDSGLGSTSFIGAYNFGNNEVTKLKIELLKYQLENAKLERQRIQDAIRAEAKTRDSLVIERALKLRTARLETTAAELKLPADHPALQFTPEEAPAEHFLNQYQH